MKRVCGLDVHKDTIFCAVHNGKSPGEVKEFLTLTESIREMGAYLHELGVEKIAMESTGIYWIPVWNILENIGFNLMLINPYLIKQMPGRKSDIKDAQWIATLLQKNLLRCSLVPCAKIRELRTYSRKYIKLQQRMTTVLQTIERTLEMSNIRITSFVTKIESKSVLSVVKRIIQGETSPDRLAECIFGSIINKHGSKIKQSLDGLVCEHQRFALELSYAEYEFLLHQSQQCEEKMQKLCTEHYSKELELLQTIPGIKLLAAMLILAETGADMRAFENSGKFSGWTGLRPRNDESAGKYKSTAITKGNRYLCALLVQVAWGAVRTKGSSFQEKFTRLAIRKNRKKALIAIARKIGVIAWNVLYYNQPYNPQLTGMYEPEKVLAKVNYHQREIIRLQKLI
jgi:transposase